MKSLVDFTKIDIEAIEEELREKGYINEEHKDFEQVLQENYGFGQIKDAKWVFHYMMNQYDGRGQSFFFAENKSAEEDKIFKDITEAELFNAWTKIVSAQKIGLKDVITEQEGNFAVSLSRESEASAQRQKVDKYLMSKLIIQKILESKEMKLDIYQSLYFTLSYLLLTEDENKDIYYENFMLPTIVNDRKEEWDRKYKYYKKKIREHQKNGLEYKDKLEILWNENRKYRVRLWKNASNVSRLWILDEKLRALVKNDYRESERRELEYLHENIDETIKSFDLSMESVDYWVLERLIGLNTSYTLYDRFQTVVEDCKIVDVKKLKEQIEEICAKFCLWKGQYSRVRIIKDVFELTLLTIKRTKGTQKVSIQSYLNGIIELLEEVIKYKDIYTLYEKMIIFNEWNKSLSKKDNYNAILVKLTEKINELEQEIFGIEWNVEENNHRKYPLLNIAGVAERNTQSENKTLSGIVFTEVLFALEINKMGKYR